MDEVGRKESEYQIKGGGDNEDSMSMSVACGVINTVDWRGRPSNPNVHGGTRASAFVLDSYLGSFWTILIFGFVELSGFILLSVQAHLPQLKPPPCNMFFDGEHCTEAKGFKALIFFLAIYLVALGSGCVKPNMIAHGADQFNQENPKQLKKLSTYFNAAYFAFSVGELVALTILVWVQTHSGMDAGFGVSAAVMTMGLISLICGTLYYRNKPPQGSIFIPVAQVFVAAILKRKQICPSNPQMLHGSQSNVARKHTNKFRFLDKACIRVQQGTGSSSNDTKESPWILCSVAQVEQAKILLSVIPIFASTIVFNTILAQLQTFSVQQGSSMDTHLTKSFHVPPASLQSIPYILLIVVVPLYDSFFVPFARKITGHESGISPLQRIGFGLFLATFSMISAALVEKKRRDAAVNLNETISIFWITPQFLIFGLSEMFTAVGLIEFFYKQSLKGMQTFFTAITYCSYSFGFYLSSLLVSMVNNISSSSSTGGWLHDNDLNKDKLDFFYWLLAALSFLNFLNYLFWSRWYSYKPSQSQGDTNANESINLFGHSSKNYSGDDNIP
ncbi:Protein NRT1/ PTR FAMILY 4.3 isoform B [Glycine soja]|uniref:Protein NRT1/ PTR FAMILY 4.3 isoform B n=1 Tax=Glycine soja TaxID=3848 RepID=A0A445HR77_GLYSO|nr:Protein NRT1/ PTR FAMILY 4.3 isoform B [Glycine soja]